jgi:hypothetical protein
MAYGNHPYLRDPLDVLIDRRRGATPPPSVLRQDAITPYESPALPVPGPAPTSPLKAALVEALGGSGQASLAAGVRAGMTESDFGRALLASLAASLGTGASARAAAADLAAKTGLQTRQVAAAEKTAEAAMIRANKQPAEKVGRRTKAEDLAGEHDFLKNTLGWSDQAISEYFKKKGERATGSATAHVTDRERLATSLVASGRAPDMDTARIIAASMGQMPQVVGSIERVMTDRANPLSPTTVRVTVARRMNQLTGNYELIDAQGNLLNDNDMKTFQAAPNQFQGGTGGSVPTPSPAPGVNLPAPPASPAPPAQVQGQVPSNEADIIAALRQPGVRPDILKAYADGKGPLGDSPSIRAVAAGRLTGTR